MLRVRIERKREGGREGGGARERRYMELLTRWFIPYDRLSFGTL